MAETIAAAHALTRAISAHLQSHFTDPMTTIDIREGDASGAMWARVDGAEFMIMVKPSARQVFKDAARSWKFSEIALCVEAEAGFPITEMRAVPEGVIVVVTAQTADGAQASVTLSLGPEQLAHPELVTVLARDACEALRRYVDSFVPEKPPSWDEQRWGE